MVKCLGILIGGIFVGAVGAEILRKKCPNAMSAMYAKFCEMTSEAKETFKKEYARVVQSQQATEPSV